jgi:hypothetical protein
MFLLQFIASTFFSSVAMEMNIDVVIGTVAANDPNDFTLPLYGEYFITEVPDHMSIGSASPITGSNANGLDLSYFA